MDSAHSFGDIPLLGFGAMRLPCGENGEIDQQQVNAMVDEYLAAGFKYFDTAYYYHNVCSEGALKKALSDRYDRNTFLLADKMPLTIIKTHEDYLPVFNAQLERAGVEWFDFYLLHNITREQIALTEQKGGFEFVRRMKEEGRIRHIGLSTHDTAEALDGMLTRHPEIEFVQLQINYLDWENESVQSRLCYETARRHGKPVIVMEPVRGGALAQIPQQARQMQLELNPDASAASYAIRFAASLEGVFMVLSGMSNMEQLRDNISYMKNFVPLSEAEKSMLFRAKDIILQSMLVPCTGCRYCTDGCPMGINIPALFAAVNECRLSPLADYAALYDKACERHGQPKDCIGCAQCERVCPQHINIIQQLQGIRI